MKKEIPDNIVSAILTGAMEEKIKWVPIESIVLEKKIIGLTRKIEATAYSGDRKIIKEILNQAIQEKNKKKLIDFKRKYTTKIDLVAPSNSFYNTFQTAYSLNRIHYQKIEVNFDIDLTENIKMSWKVFDINRLNKKSDTPLNLSDAQYKFETTEPDSNLLMLPSLITEKHLARSLSEIMEKYCYDTRTKTTYQGASL